MRHTLPMLAAVAMVVALLLPFGTAVAAPATVTGTVAAKEDVALSSGATLIVTLVDQQAAPEAGAIIAQQQIDGAVLPAAFSIAYDDADIDADHSYAVFASVLDGSTTLQSYEAVPVITGGPSADVSVVVSAPGPTATGSLTGTITGTDLSALTADAVAYAVLVKADTGTLVARTVIPAPADPISFTIQGDPGVIDPAATYVVKAAIVDGGQTWQNAAGVPAIEGGQLVSGIEVPVTLIGAPAASAAPSSPPSAAPSAAPTAEPTAAPTAEPTATPTPAPTATPTPAPTEAPTATPAPTEAPTATPTASPTAAASASPTQAPSASSSPTASPGPDTGVISGQLTYNEPHELSPEARAVVLLVEGSQGPSAGTTVASTHITGPSEPVDFELAYPFSAIKPDTTYRLYGGIVDGDLAWVTPIGVAVDVPQPSVSGLEIPLQFRPDLLKAAVTGTLTGVGLDSARNPEAYGTALLIRVNTGETVGFQLITPTGAAPVPFSVPYDPAAITRDEDYVARGSIWDGTTLWNTDVGTPVITNDNANSGVALTVTAVPTPTPAPTPAPSAEVSEPEGGGSNTLLLVLAAIGAIAVVGVLIARRRSRTGGGSA